MPTESFEGTLIDDPADPGIVDAFSNVYRLTGTSEVSVNGIVDKTPGVVTALTYSGRTIWRKDYNGNWRPRRHPQDPSEDRWGPSQRASPIQLDRIENRIETIATDVQSLAALGEPIKALTAGLADTQATWNADLALLHTSVLALTEPLADLLSENVHIRATLADLFVMLTAVNVTVTDIMALVSVNRPTKLAIDMANAEIRPQPVPDKPGP